MKSYISIVEDILRNGVCKSATRHYNNQTVQATLSLPNIYWYHNMEEGFPLLTIRDMRRPLRQAAVELEGFLKGITSKSWYKGLGCNYWNWWSNPASLNITDNMSKEDRQNAVTSHDDLGAIYPHQLRRFGEAIDEEDNGVIKGTDQLKFVLDMLKNHPYDRGIQVSYWNPNQISRMALRPCHISWRVTVLDDVLNLHWDQRSCDLMLGSNIHSYALLMLLLCKWSGFKAGKLSAVFGDCHIYNDQRDTIDKFISNTPYKLPELHIKDFGDNDPAHWSYKNYQLSDYQSHKCVKFPKPEI